MHGAGAGAASSSLLLAYITACTAAQLGERTFKGRAPFATNSLKRGGGGGGLFLRVGLFSGDYGTSIQAPVVQAPVFGGKIQLVDKSYNHVLYRR